jgi:hypothetical protein
MLEEVLAAVVQLAFGHVEGLSIAIPLLVGAHYLGYLKRITVLARNLRLMAFVVAALMLAGVLDVGEVMGLVSASEPHPGGLLGGVLP